MRTFAKIVLVAITAISMASCSSNTKPENGDDTSTFTNNSQMRRGNTDSTQKPDSTSTDTTTSKPQ
ncbi:entericidin [Mucilaginibacter lacusdianchii]|uniref:entericidin n=1 Tax=Mucilaginibacter lacusdianchii TaxID=2684211 RepID=UPI00131B6CE6|nr:entericidin [Mucilaginibacter sp. JXJ CY 39]